MNLLLITKLIFNGIIGLYSLNVNSPFKFSNNELKFKDEFEILKNEELFQVHWEYQHNNNHNYIISVVNFGTLESDSYESIDLIKKKIKMQVIEQYKNS